MKTERRQLLLKITAAAAFGPAHQVDEGRPVCRRERRKGQIRRLQQLATPSCLASLR